MVDQVKEIYVSQTKETLLWWQQGQIKNQKLLIENKSAELFKRGSMYTSWTIPKQMHFKSFNFVDKFLSKKNQNPRNGCLFIFDTWGTSSYYHLLIDHIIPLWITKEFLKKNVSEISKVNDFYYYRISKNDYQTELSTSNDIFKYFMDCNFTDEIEGKFEHIIYGYLYKHRPYHGPMFDQQFIEEYEYFLTKFRRQYSVISPLKDNIIIVPYRKDRRQEFVSKFVQKYGDKFNFKSVDFSLLSIEEQIKVCGTARGIFGDEGAAFSNQLFLPNNSIVAPVCNEPERFAFHQPLSRYCNHTFLPVQVSGTDCEGQEKYLLKQINDHFEV